ncbi:MAG: carboxypeptidase [Candidatus Heimdallarchaeota archaeon]|nr:carboxypeptidase [Candidatus Heimdallarchaeota archaeon]
MGLETLPQAEDFDFKYYKHEEMRSLLASWQDIFPDLMKLEVIGQTYEGRDIWVAKITNFMNCDSDLDKPAYYVEANIHAGEVTGSTVSLYTIYYLLSHYEKESQISNLLDKFTFYVVPRISADGAERYLTSPHILRSSTRWWPFDEKLPGFHEDDINNDGEILLMRKEDPLGDWKISDKDPRLMIKRAIDDFGEGPFYRMYPEGTMHKWKEGEPTSIARSPEGLDLNRNNPSGPWAQEYKQSGAGPFPHSEPETRSIADFFRAHPNICGVQSFHTFSGVILRPLSFTSDDALETHDLEVYQHLGKVGEKLTGYPCININKDFKYERKSELLGGFLDWVLEHFGIFSFSTELWDMIKEAGIEDRDFIKFLMYERTEEEELKLLKWNDDVLKGEGFVNWSEYEHSQLGKVEIGGWKFKYTWQNPPLINNYLQDICHKNMLFNLAHAQVNPRVYFQSYEIEKLENNAFKVYLSIMNTGFLPTYVSQQALMRKVAHEGKLKIEGEVELIAPIKDEITIPHLQGRSNKMRASIFGGLSPEDQKWTYNVVVKAKPGTKVTFRVSFDRAGKDSLSVELK